LGFSFLKESLRYYLWYW